MDDLKIDDLVIHVDQSAPACVRLDWRGRSTAGNPGEKIGPFFERVLAEASDAGCFVDMHFEPLEEANSSTITTLIHLIYAAGRAKVALRIRYDPDKKWQSLAFEALKRVVHLVGSGEGLDVEFFTTRS
jgi:hypothetical protein